MGKEGDGAKRAFPAGADTPLLCSCFVVYVSDIAKRDRDGRCKSITAADRGCNWMHRPPGGTVDIMEEAECVI